MTSRNITGGFYLEIEDLQYISYIEDLLLHHSVKKLAFYEHHRSTTRFNHSLSVSYNSYKTAKRLGFSNESLREIARAGLLHDLFFYDTSDEKDTKEHLRKHPEIALENARNVCQLSEKEENIILSHMFGVSFNHVPKYKESFLVSFTDKTVSIREVYHRLRKRERAYLIRNTLLD